MADLGMWSVDGDAPQRVDRSGVGVERRLEDWIASESSLLAGVGVDGWLKRIAAHLGGYGVPITIVSFEAFEPDGGPLLLVRTGWPP